MLPIGAFLLKAVKKSESKKIEHVTVWLDFVGLVDELWCDMPYYANLYIDPKMRISELDFDYLFGLDVTLHAKNLCDRSYELIDKLIAANPRSLMTFYADLDPEDEYQFRTFLMEKECIPT